MKIPTFNTLQDWPKVNQYARLLCQEYKNEVMQRHYKHKERTGYLPTYRGHDAYTQVTNTIYWKAGQDLEPHIQHIPGRKFGTGDRHTLIEIPYFAYIPNPNGTPGSKQIWLSISPWEGIYLYMEAPTGERVYHRPRGNRPATWENIQQEAQRLFLQHYLPDTHPAAIWQYHYGITKSQAIKARIIANKTEWYRAGTRNKMNPTTYEYYREFWIESCQPPQTDPERAVIRRLRRKYRMKVCIDPLDITPRILSHLLKMDRCKTLTEVHRAPSIWELMEEASQEHDTDEGLESYVHEHFNQYPKTAIFV